MPKTISKAIRLSEHKELFEENLLKMEQDEAYKKEQHELAEADFS